MTLLKIIGKFSSINELLLFRNGVIHVEPADVIIVEGILIFYDEKLRNKFSMKLFVDADADIRLARRVRRDTVERKRPLSTVLSTYTSKVSFFSLQIILSIGETGLRRILSTNQKVR